METKSVWSLVLSSSSRLLYFNFKKTQRTQGTSLLSLFQCLLFCFLLPVSPRLCVCLSVSQSVCPSPIISSVFLTVNMRSRSGSLSGNGNLNFIPNHLRVPRCQCFTALSWAEPMLNWRDLQKTSKPRADCHHQSHIICQVWWGFRHVHAECRSPRIKTWKGGGLDVWSGILSRLGLVWTADELGAY